ncbi:hypothetical protein TNCV_2907241 [Trichonephila clavipes]|nr:hypothetical protein TNCV_2907241 [Trichonephila clavipes]
MDVCKCKVPLTIKSDSVPVFLSSIPCDTQPEEVDHSDPSSNDRNIKPKFGRGVKPVNAQKIQNRDFKL